MSFSWGLLKIDNYVLVGKFMKKILLIIIVMISVFSVFAVSKFTQTVKNAELENLDKNFILPVNVLNGSKNHSCLKVCVSQDFELVADFENMTPSLIEASKKDVFKLEFLPKIDKKCPYTWSEAIIVTYMRGCLISASCVVNQIIIGFFSDHSPIKVTELQHLDYESYQKSSCFMTYIEKGNRKAIIFLDYYSGPCDCAGFQYTIILNDAMTEEKAKQKIKKFIANNVNLLSYSKDLPFMLTDID